MDMQVVNGGDVNNTGVTGDDDSVFSGSSSESSVGKELELVGASRDEEEPETETPKRNRLFHLLGHLWHQKNMEPEQVAEYLFYLTEEVLFIIPGHQLNKNGKIIPDPRQLVMEEMGEESVRLFARAALYHFGGYENEEEPWVCEDHFEHFVGCCHCWSVGQRVVHRSFKDAAEIVFNDAGGRHGDENYDVE